MPRRASCRRYFADTPAIFDAIRRLMPPLLRRRFFELMLRYAEMAAFTRCRHDAAASCRDTLRH